MHSQSAHNPRSAAALRRATVAVFFASAAAPALISPARATTYYVSPNGSDTNSGTSPSSPWQSVNQVDNATFNPGDQVLFQDGGNWYGSLNISSSGTAAQPITFGSYGSGANPTFWGSNVVASQSFQPVSGASNTYSLPYSNATPVNSFFVNDQFSVSASLATGSGSDSTNISYVEATPNTWYYDSNNSQLYVNTGSPLSSKNTYSVAVRENAINTNNQSNLVINNLTTNETARYNGGYGIDIYGSNNVTLNNCQALNGGKHNVGVIDSNATLNNVLAAGVMPNQGVGGATAFVSYSDYRYTGNTSVYNNCVVANYPNEPAFYNHSDYPSNLTGVTLNNFISYGAPVSVQMTAAGNTSLIKGGLVVNTSLGLSGYSTADGVRVAGPGAYIGLSGSNNLVQNTVVAGAAPSNPYYAAVIDQGANDVLRYSTISMAPNAIYYAHGIDLTNANSNFQAYGNIINSTGQALQTYYQINASPQYSAPNDFKLSDNLYNTPGSAEFANVTGNNPITLAQMQAMGLDAGSVDGTPVYYNAATNQYELQSGSPGTGLVPLNSSTQGDLYDFTGAPRPQSGYDNAGAYGPNSVATAPQSINSTWNGINYGSWSENFEWSGGVPQFAGNTANFDALEYGATYVSLDGSWTVGTINFNNAQGYTLYQGAYGNLTLNNNAAAAQINVLTGSHLISVPVVLTNGLTLAVGQSASVLTISGNITGAGGIKLAATSTASSVGTVVLSGANSYTGGTTVNSGTLIAQTGSSIASGPLTITGGAVQLAVGAGAAHVTSLAIRGNGTLDLTSNTLMLSYTGSSPIAAIAAEIQSAYAGGTWSGAGITSSLLAGGSAKYALGYADSADPGDPAGLASGTIKIMYALLGDANLDGKVNGADFAILATNFNKAVNGVSGWDQGDFNYDGKINGADFASLAQNFNQGVGSADTSAALAQFAQAAGLNIAVPEPFSASMALLGIGGMLLRRRKR
jgi:autotransporter-associated beta strand protein